MKWWRGGLLLLAGLAGAANAVLTFLGHIMDPRWGSQGDNLVLTVLLTIAGLTVAGLVLNFKGARPRWLLGVVVLIAAAAIVPTVYETRQRGEIREAQNARLLDLESRTLARIEARKKDIEARIAERHPYQGDEARDFIAFVTGADLTAAGGRDHSVQTIAMLRQALETKILDPNTIVKEPVYVNPGAEPLFIKFYRQARPAPERSVLARDWKILKLLADNGADLSIPAAAPFAADLRKAATPVFNGLYFELK